MPTSGPQYIQIQEFIYDLPDSRIAKHPLPQRDASKLLVFRDAQIEEDVYTNISTYLEPGALLVFNNTRVIPARLQFVKPSGGMIEVFCLEPEGELAGSMAQSGSAVWKCLVGGIKKWKSEDLVLEIKDLQLTAKLLERGPESCRIQFSWTPEQLTFAEMLEISGQVPLPPYLQRAASPDDRERYQTIYARYDGSVAAPTAGLHFTDNVFQRLGEKNIDAAYLTLHVGAGTFKPVKSDTIGGHEMHGEYFDVSADTIRQLRGQLENKGQLVAVGTTALRTLESLYLMGCKLSADPDLSLEALEIKQWDAFTFGKMQIEMTQSLDCLLLWMSRRGLDRVLAKTQLLIAPGYRIRMVDALVTNFHQPASTLLLLVAALVGENWRKIYTYALENDFRFLSYGDGSLLYNQRQG